jgi:hypothetical protein
MGWDYVCELWPPVDLLFISEMIYEYGEPRWNGIDREKLKKSERKLFQWYTVHHKSNMDWPGHKTRPALAQTDGGLLCMRWRNFWF